MNILYQPHPNTLDPSSKETTSDMFQLYSKVNFKVTVDIKFNLQQLKEVDNFAVLLRFSVKVDGVRSFTLEEMATATNNFNDSAEIGQGGYGKIHKGNLDDGATVAIKRAQEDSLQGSNEFCTEIGLLRFRMWKEHCQLISPLLLRVLQ